MKDGKAENIDEFLGTLSDVNRAALESLRKQIHAAQPDFEEAMTYGVPTFRYKGKMAVSMGAAKKHLAFYPTPGPVEAFKERLAGFVTSKGAVQFSVEKPLPEDLVRDIVRMRVEEISAGGKK